MKMSRTRRVWLAGAASLVLVAGMAACGSGGGGGAASGGKQSGETTTELGTGESGELTFVYMGDADQQKAFNAEFALFNEQHPDIKLTAMGIPSGDWATFSNTVATRLAGGEKIDIIQVATEGQRLFASKDILEPLDQFIEQDREFVDGYWEDIDPRLKEFNEKYASGPNGETLFIPGGYNTMALYLNKNVFAEAGVEIPADGNWTWDQFLEAARTIKEKTGAYMMPASSSYFGAVMPWLTTNGASTFNDDWTVPTYNTPAAIESAQFARQLVEEGLVPEPGGQFDVNSAFTQGTLAAIDGGRWVTLGIRDMEMVDNTVVVNWPTKVGNGSPVGWDAWNITKRSENKEAAWTFIKFLMSEEAGEYFASVGGTIVPARLSVAESSAFTDNAPEHVTRLAEAMSWATAIPSIDRGSEAQKVIEEAWLTVISGQGDAQGVLDAAQSELESLAQ